MQAIRQGSRRGFTLVEVIVVVTIIAILASLIYRGFAGYVAAQQFRAGVVEVSSLIHEARQRTLASERDSRHGVHFATSTVTSFVGRTYDPSDPENVAADLDGLTLASNLTGGASSLSFARLSGVPSATGTIMLTSTRTGATSSITVTGTGIIK